LFCSSMNDISEFLYDPGGAKACACPWHELEVEVQRKLEAPTCSAGMFRAKSKEHEGTYCKGHDPERFRDKLNA
jgi:hypothetical protein